MKKNSFWRTFIKIFGIIMLSIVGLFLIFLIYSYINHKEKLKEEEALLDDPPGELVDVDGHDIHVMHEGNTDGEYTLVFLHGNKTVDDSIVLQPLFDKLSGYDLLYVDRSGVGYSEDAGVSKDIDSMVSETRQAVQTVCDKKKYVLVASKSAGLMAFYWAKTYPDEVEAIVGLEMYLPEQYAELDDDAYSGITSKLGLWFIKLGAHRFASDAMPENTFSIYTDKQMEIRKALVAKGLYTDGMYEEDKQVVKNGKKVAELGWPDDVPMYLIYANPFMDPYLHLDEDMLEIYEEVAEQGEEYDCEKSYNSYYRETLANYANVTMEEISGPERITTYRPEVLAEKIKGYLDNLQ